MKNLDNQNYLFPISQNLVSIFEKSLSPANETTKQILKSKGELKKEYGINLFRKEIDYKEEINREVNGIMRSLSDGMGCAGKKYQLISKNHKLDNNICIEVSERLGLENYQEFCNALYSELKDYVSQNSIERKWGSLKILDGELVLVRK